MSPSLRSQRDDRGVVALELVLALPAILMLIIGAVVLGSYLSQQTQTMGQAHDGARAAALGQTLPDGATIVQGSCPDTDDVTVSVTQIVRLTRIPLIPIDIVPATITEEATMRCGG